jgi:uncharacterized RmlC-like cupin family protein
VTGRGLPYEIRAPVEATQGAFRLIEIEEPPRREADIHVHSFDEAWYVVEGAYAVCLAGTWLVVRGGDFLFVPGGTPHGFAVTSDQSARKLAIAVGGGSSSFEATPLGAVATPPELASNPGLEESSRRTDEECSQ